MEVRDLLVGVLGEPATLRAAFAFSRDGLTAAVGPPLAEGLGGELGEVALAGDAERLLHDPRAGPSSMTAFASRGNMLPNWASVP